MLLLEQQFWLFQKEIQILRRTLVVLAATAALGCLPVATNAFAAGYIAGHGTVDDFTGGYGDYASSPGFGYGSPGPGYAGYGNGYGSTAYGYPGYAYGDPGMVTPVILAMLMAMAAATPVMVMATVRAAASAA